VSSGSDKPPEPSESGSIDVALSGSKLPVADGAPVAIAHADSALVSSGAVAAVPTESSGTVKALAGDAAQRSGRLRNVTGKVVGAGVSKLGTGIGNLGEGVSKLGEKSRKIPVVGSSVAKLGEGISQVGESLHELPRVAATRSGRLLVRSLFVGFVLVAAWISVIVALQLHGNETPDFRPIAEELLVKLSSGGPALDEIYDQASPRFQEMVRKERFVDDMNDLNATVGKFREITAVRDTLVTSGPTGDVGRVSLTVAYAKATCKASVSFHYDQDRWKMLGIGVELPPGFKITKEQREERVQACKDPMAKTCDLHEVANAILEKLRDGHADAVWDDATSVFQKQEDRSRFMQIQAEHAAILGDYRRIIAVTEAKVIGGTLATYDILTEYARSMGVRAIFGFYRSSKTQPWKLRSFKLVLPMPRADEQEIARPAETKAGVEGGTVKPPEKVPPRPSPRPRSSATSSGATLAGSASAGPAASGGSGSGSAAR